MLGELNEQRFREYAEAAKHYEGVARDRAAVDASARGARADLPAAGAVRRARGGARASRSPRPSTTTRGSRSSSAWPICTSALREAAARRCRARGGAPDRPAPRRRRWARSSAATTRLRAWPELVRVLELRVRMADSTERAERLLARIAELLELKMEDAARGDADVAAHLGPWTRRASAPCRSSLGWPSGRTTGRRRPRTRRSSPTSRRAPRRRRRFTSPSPRCSPRRSAIRSSRACTTRRPRRSTRTRREAWEALEKEARRTGDYEARGAVPREARGEHASRRARRRNSLSSSRRCTRPTGDAPRRRARVRARDQGGPDERDRRGGDARDARARPTLGRARSRLRRSRRRDAARRRTRSAHSPSCGSRPGSRPSSGRRTARSRPRSRPTARIRRSSRRTISIDARLRRCATTPACLAQAAAGDRRGRRDGDGVRLPPHHRRSSPGSGAPKGPTSDAMALFSKALIARLGASATRSRGSPISSSTREDWERACAVQAEARARGQRSGRAVQAPRRGGRPVGEARAEHADGGARVRGGARDQAARLGSAPHAALALRGARLLGEAGRDAARRGRAPRRADREGQERYAMAMVVRDHLGDLRRAAALLEEVLDLDADAPRRLRADRPRPHRAARLDGAEARLRAHAPPLEVAGATSSCVTRSSSSSGSSTATASATRRARSTPSGRRSALKPDDGRRAKGDGRALRRDRPARRRGRAWCAPR